MSIYCGLNVERIVNVEVRMSNYLMYAIIVFVVSILGLLGAAAVAIPISYAIVIPPLAGACIAAFNRKDGKK